MGGEIDLKVMGKPYEPVTAKAMFEIEMDDDGFSDDTIEALEAKVNNQLQKQLRNQARIALQEQNYVRNNMQRIINGID